MKGIIYSLLLLLLQVSCNKPKKLSLLVSEWNGKEINFPHEVKCSFGECDTLNFVVPTTDYKLITYVDSIGCVSCKLQLQKWKELIRELDSIPFLFFLHPKNKNEMKMILRSEHFNYPVCIDELDSLNKLNHFPSDMRFQTFLLDKDNKVIAIGNPVHNPKVKELYMKIILGDKAPAPKDKIKTTAAVETSLIGLGEFDWKEEQKATFKLKNTGAQPLVILDVTTSCGCISANFPKEPVAPGSEAEITVVYKADKPEHFNKTVTVYCNAEDSPFTVKVTGVAK